jgi:c-di-GMP-binding flagellar brake protein YcgR
MPESTDHERRKYVRVSANFTVTVRHDGNEITYPAVFVRDISTGGIGLEISGNYPDSYERLTHTADPVAIDVDLGDDQILHFTAHVVWGLVEASEVDGKRPFKIGLKFTELDGETRDRLQAFIRTKVDEALRQHAAARINRRTPTPGSNSSV